MLRLSYVGGPLAEQFYDDLPDTAAVKLATVQRVLCPAVRGGDGIGYFRDQCVYYLHEEPGYGWVYRLYPPTQEGR